MSYKEYVEPFDTAEEAYAVIVKKLKTWSKVRGNRIMRVEKYQHKFWIVIVEE